MSEKLHAANPEVGRHEQEPKASAERPKAAEYGKAEQEQHIESAQAAVAAAEASSANHVAMPHLADSDQTPQIIDKGLRQLRMQKSLKHIQKRLKPSEKSFSKVVHQPLVQKVSEASAQTVARPSGIFGGGLVAFAGSLAYLWMTRHYSLTYNYFVFLTLFVGGFFIGLLGEYLLHRLRSRSRA